MPKLLKNLRLSEVSLVDDPANAHATVDIFKSKGTSVTPEALLAIEAALDKFAVTKGLASASDGMKAEAAKLSEAVTKALNDTAINDKATAINALVAEFQTAIVKMLPGIEAVAKSQAGGLPTESDAALAAAELKDTIMKTLAELTAELETAQSEVTKLRTDSAAKDDVIKAKDAEIVKLQGEIAEVKKSGAPTEEDVTKGMTPVQKAAWDAMAKANRDNAEAIAKMQEDRENDEAIAKAKVLPGDPKLVGPALRRIRIGKSTEADAVLIEGVLKAAAERDKIHPLFKNNGSENALDANDPEEMLKAKAVEIQKAKPALSYEQAYSEALDANPKLYEAVVAKGRSKANG